MNKVILNIIFLFFVFGFCSAQYQISGTIQSIDEDSPIEFVDVYIEENQQLVTTDQNGYFEFSDLEKGEYNLVCVATEYNILNQQVNLDQNITLDLKMDRLSIDLSAIEISAKRKEIFALKKLKDIEGTSVYAGKKTEVIVLDLINANKGANVSRQIYAQVAGLNIYEGNDGGIQLGIGGRGLDPNRTSNFNTRQNGYDISADVLGYPENYYTPPANAIEEIQIVRGASSLQYGTQFGGLINFKLKKHPKQKDISILSTQTYGSFGLFDSYNYLGFNKGNWTANISYNHKRGNGYRDNSDFTVNNLFLNSEYDFGKGFSISADYTHFNYLAQQAGGLTDSQFQNDSRLSTRTRNWFKVNWNLYEVNLKHEWTKNLNWSLSLFGLNASRKSVGFRGNPTNLNENPILALDEQNINGDFILPRDLIIGDFNNFGLEYRILNKYKIQNLKSVLLLGFKYYDANNTSFQGPGTNDIDADFTEATNLFPDYASQSDFELPNNNLAFFGEHIFYLNDKLSLTPGFRYEFIKTGTSGNYRQVVFDNAGNPIANNLLNEERNLSRNFLLLGLGLEYKKNNAFKVYGNISENYRSVTFSDIRVVNPTFIVDENIKDENGITADIGLSGRFQKWLSYEANFYTILYNDRIGIILNQRANRERKNIGDARILGFESLIDFNLDRLIWNNQPDKRLNLFLNTAITESEYTSSEENNVVGNQVEFVPTLNIKSGLKFGIKNILASFQYSYLSKQYTDAQNSEIAGVGDIREGIIGEIESYSVLDFLIEYNIKKYQISAGVNNLLDKAYFTRRATGYPGPGIIPSDGRSFFVTISFRL